MDRVHPTLIPIVIKSLLIQIVVTRIIIRITTRIPIKGRVPMHLLLALLSLVEEMFVLITRSSVVQYYQQYLVGLKWI